MGRRTWILVAVLVLAGVAKLVWTSDGGTRAVSSAPVPTAVASPPPAPQTPGTPVVETEPELEVPPEAEAAVDPERLAMIRRDERLREAARQQLLARAADARWNEAVDGGEYRARDLDPGVRRAFASMQLEPRYAAEGRIDGLGIEELPEGHALARAGFREGDRLTRIQGVDLRDPAELPALLDRLGPHVSFCVDREGDEICREVALD